MRENLKTANGKRLRFTATVERFGTKPNWHGFPEKTLLLKDIRFADTGIVACDHLWFKHGNWSVGLLANSTFSFDARVDSYVKGYQGGRAERLGECYQELDYHLERPTKVVVGHVPIGGSL